MSLRKIDANRYKQTFNVGDWLGAKIYSDIKDNCCGCGGTFTAYQTLKRRLGDILYPVCNKCSLPPEKFRIRAKIIDHNGKKKYVFIRHTETGDRLSDISDVLGVLNKVDADIELGKFDSRKYDSKKTRDQFLFKNLQKAYLEYFENQYKAGEITYYGIKGKRKYSKFLLKFFANIDINMIDDSMVDDFKNSITESLSNRREGVNELKTMLRWGYKKKLVSRLPAWSAIKANKRSAEDIPNLKITREEVIPHIKNYAKRTAIKAIVDYGLRPCEIRAVKRKKCNLITNEVTFDEHFSGTELVKGRKSNKDGKYASLTRKMTKSFREYVQSLPESMGPEDFIFQGEKGGPMPEKALSKEWAKTLKELELPHVEMYGVRHARGTEVINSTDGNFMEAKEFLGHSDIKTTLGTYASYELKHMSKYFSKEELADVLPMVRES